MPGKFNTKIIISVEPTLGDLDEGKMEPNIDFRIHGIPHAAVEQEEDDRTRLIGMIIGASSQESFKQRRINRRFAEYWHEESLQQRSETDDAQYGKRGLLRAVRGLFQNPVSPLSRVLDNNHAHEDDAVGIRVCRALQTNVVTSRRNVFCLIAARNCIDLYPGLTLNSQSKKIRIDVF